MTLSQPRGVRGNATPLQLSTLDASSDFYLYPSYPFTFHGARGYFIFSSGLYNIFFFEFAAQVHGARSWRNTSTMECYQD